MEDSFSNTEQTLFSLIRSSMFGVPDENTQSIESIDWDDLYREAKGQAITALIADCVPGSAGNKWKAVNTRNLFNNVCYLHAQNELINIFHENNIPLVILKGTAAAVYYPVPLNRAMGDIDFIVPHHLFIQACCLMKKSGYIEVNESSPHERHKVYSKGRFMYELHHQFSDDDMDIERYIFYGLRNIDFRRIDGIEFPMLPNLSNGLVLLAHIRHHLRGGLGLRQVIDWMMYVYEELDDSFWESDFCEAVTQVGMQKLAITVTRMCQMYLGLGENITWCRRADENLCLQLMEYLLSYGNFGKKLGEGMVFDRTSTIIHRMGFFQYLKLACEKKYDIYNRHIWLRPLFWFYQIIYLLKKSLKMKRVTRIFSDMEQSRKKNDLLKQLDAL